MLAFPFFFLLLLNRFLTIPMAVQRTEREEDSNHRYRRRVFVLSRAPAGYLFFFFFLDLLQKLREAEKKKK